MRDNKHPTVQLSADATAVSQAGVGMVYIQEIFNKESYNYLKKTSPLGPTTGQGANQRVV